MSNVRIGFRSLNKLDKFIRVHKDKSNKKECRDVVYKINCGGCDASYVGQTKRQLSTRVKEHKYNIRLDPSKHSVISQHILQTNHTFDCDNAKIWIQNINIIKDLYLK